VGPRARARSRALARAVIVGSRVGGERRKKKERGKRIDGTEKTVARKRERGGESGKANVAVNQASLPLPNYCQAQLELTWEAGAKSKSRGGNPPSITILTPRAALSRNFLPSLINTPRRRTSIRQFHLFSLSPPSPPFPFPELALIYTASIGEKEEAIFFDGISMAASSGTPESIAADVLMEIDAAPFRESLIEKEKEKEKERKKKNARIGAIARLRIFGRRTRQTTLSFILSRARARAHTCIRSVSLGAKF